MGTLSISSISTHNITDIDARDGAFGATHPLTTQPPQHANKLVDSAATFLTVEFKLVQLLRIRSSQPIPMSQRWTVKPTLSVNNDIFTSAESYSVYTNKYGSVTFENEGTDDFRLDQDDTLQSIKELIFLQMQIMPSMTIEGDERNFNDSWDIGADEYVPTKNLSLCWTKRNRCPGRRHRQSDDHHW